MSSLHVSAVARESRTTSRGDVYWGIKVGQEWLNYVSPNRPEKGPLEVELNGKWARPVKGQVQASKAAASNGGPKPVTWWAYVDAIREAHGVALELEPNEALARSAIVNTAMIAFTEGRLLFSDPEPDPDKMMAVHGGPEEEIPF